MSKMNITYASDYDTYCEIYNSDGQVYNHDAAAFEAFDSANRISGYYAYPMTETDGTYTSDDDFPSLDAATYTVKFYVEQVTDQYSDDDYYADYSTIVWNGSSITKETQAPNATLDAYVSAAAAEAFFKNRLPETMWTEATVVEKVQALNMATQAIDKLNYIGERASTSQTHQFPRDDDSEVPQDIKDACCLCAVKFLDDWNSDDVREEMVANYQAIGPVKRSSERDAYLPHLTLGIPSAEAWDLLVPYLRQPGALKLDRIS